MRYSAEWRYMPGFKRFWPSVENIANAYTAVSRGE